jgi:hypothetical protein
MFETPGASNIKWTHVDAFADAFQSKIFSRRLTLQIEAGFQVAP